LKENIVEIPEGSGNHYRYGYQDGSTIYLGPVGDAPALAEAEFNRLMMGGMSDFTRNNLRVALQKYNGEWPPPNLNPNIHKRAWVVDSDELRAIQNQVVGGAEEYFEEFANDTRKWYVFIEELDNKDAILDDIEERMVTAVKKYRDMNPPKVHVMFMTKDQWKDEMKLTYDMSRSAETTSLEERWKRTYSDMMKLDNQARGDLLAFVSTDGRNFELMPETWLQSKWNKIDRRK